MSKPYRRSGQKPLSEVIEKIVGQYKLTEGLKEVSFTNEWPEIVGPLIAKYTSNLKVRNKVLYLRCEMAPLKEELNFRREEIIALVNQKMGEGYIERMVIN